jgi:hypothetical protein
MPLSAATDNEELTACQARRRRTLESTRTPMSNVAISGCA